MLLYSTFTSILCLFVCTVQYTMLCHILYSSVIVLQYCTPGTRVLYSTRYRVQYESTVCAEFLDMEKFTSILCLLLFVQSVSARRSAVGGRVGGKNVRGQGSGVSGGSYPGRRLGCFMMG